MHRFKTADGFKGWSVDENFATCFDSAQAILRERNGQVLADRMDSPRRKRLILKATIAGTPIVIKHEFFVFRFDRSIKAFLFGSDARNIFKLCVKAWRRGFRKIPRTYLVAEKFSGGILRESISVTEFLQGDSPLPPFDETLKNEIGQLITDCHANGIISGDIQFDNFIITQDGVKLIDFRGNKVFPWLAKARDRIQLERVFGIPNQSCGFSEKIFTVQHFLRNTVRKLRGKPLIED